MKKGILLIELTLIVFISCNKNNSKTSAPTSGNLVNQQANYYSFKIGTTTYSASSVYGQIFEFPNIDTLLMVNGGNNTDTISGSFTLKVTSIGSFNHDSTSVSQTNRFVVNFGTNNNPHSTFYSKSGTINISSYDKVNNLFSGTFSAVMYLSTNPTYTLPLTNGGFYLKY